MVNGAFIAGAGFFGLFIGIIASLLYMKRKQKKEKERLQSDTDLHERIKAEHEKQKEVSNAKQQSVKQLREQKREELKSDTTVGTDKPEPSGQESSASGEIQSTESSGDELSNNSSPLRY
ncbi:MAG: hypothetical protein ABEI74_04830 [Candidatus Pacearchaeota archaeon]